MGDKNREGPYSHDDLFRIVKLSSDMVIHTDPQGIIEGMEKGEGVAPLNLSNGGSILDIVAPDQREEVMDLLRRAGETGKQARLELRCVGGDGSGEFYFDATILPMRDDQSVRRLTFILRDNNERRRYQRYVRESEARLREIIELLPEAVFELDRQGRMVYLNRAGMELFGISEDAIKAGVDGFMFFAPEYVDKGRKAFEELLAGRKPGKAEYIGQNKDGRRFPAIVHSGPVFEGDEVVGVRGIIIDISERQEKEDALQQGQALMRALIDATTESMFLVDKDLRILMLNEIGAERLGGRIEEFIGIDADYAVENFPHYDVWVRRVEKIREIMKHGQPYREEDERGDYVFDTNYYPILDEDGNAHMLAVFARDITAERTAERILHRSAETARALMDAVDECMVLIDGDLSFITGNSSALEHLGKGMEELVGRSIADIFDEHIGEGPGSRRVELIKECFRTGEAVVYKENLDGKYYNLTFYPIKNETNEVDRLAIISRDVTRDKIADEEIRKFKTIIDYANYGAAIAKLDGTITYINDHFARMHGYTTEELIGKNLGMFHNDIQLPRVNELLTQLKERGGFEFEEVWHVKRDGAEFPTLMSGTLIKDADGIPQFMVGIAIDISEDARTRNELKSERDFVNSLLETANSLILCLDEKAHIKVFNSGCELVTGYSRDEVIGKSWPDLFLPEESWHSGLQDFYDWVKEHPRDMYEGTIITKSGEEKRILWSNSVIFEEGTGRLTAIAVGQDITERKRAEDSIVIERDLGMRLSRSASFTESLEACLDAAFSISGMDCGGVYVVNEKEQSVNLEAHKNLSKEFVEQVSYFDKDSINAKILFKGEPLYAESDNIHEPYEQFPLPPGLKSLAILPVGYMGKIIASLNVASYTIGVVSENARAALESIASRIGTSIIRAKNDEEIRDKERRFNALFNSINDFVFVIDSLGHILHVNSRVESRLGFDRDYLAGRRIGRFISEFNEEVITGFTDDINGGDSELKLGSLKTAEGESIAIESQVTRGSWGNDDVLFIIGRDITERLKAEQKLRESEERFRSFVENAEAVVYSINPEGVIEYVSPKVEQFTGYEIEEIVGKTFDDFLHPDDISEAMEFMRGLLESDEKSGGIVNRIRKKDGSYGWFMTNAAPIKDETDRGMTYIGITHDITDKIKAEQQLRESEEKLRSTLTSMDDLVFVMDAEGRFLEYYQPSRTHSLYKPPSEFMGKSFRELLPGELVEIIENSIRKLRETGEVQKIDYSLEIKGNVEWFSGNLSLRMDYEGNISGVTAVIRNITQRKTAENALRESEEKYRSLIENASQPILAMDPEGLILTINRAATEYMGVTPESCKGKYIYEFLPDKAVIELREALREIAETLKGMAVSRSYVFKGKKSYFKSFFQPLFTSDDKLYAIQVIVYDVTDERKQEIHNKARVELHEDLRNATKVDECLTIGCKAINNAELFRRSVLSLHNEQKHITNIGYWGLDDTLIEATRNAPAPDDELTAILTHEDFRISRSYFIPEESGVFDSEYPRYVAQEKRRADCEASWKSRDELFVPLKSGKGRIEGWLSVDTPYDGCRPDINVIRFLEEIVDITTRKVREILTMESLNKERLALKNKNVALKEVLKHIEDEKAGTKKQFAESIERTLLPALKRLVRRDSKVDRSMLKIIDKGLKELAEASGGNLHLYSKLTAREIEICDLIRGGSTSDQISAKLKISKMTVNKHRESIRRKLGLTNKKVNLTTFLRNP
ncbi:MAG: PAS domain S-box protein [candidate division Zixibacteria bacterium]|nr:PAS domain S-box protein [candidate division Zixibacteria bacterium]